MAAELGDKVMVFDSAGTTMTALLTSRNADGSVVITDPFGIERQAEAIVVYRLL